MREETEEREGGDEKRAIEEKKGGEKMGEEMRREGVALK